MNDTTMETPQNASPPEATMAAPSLSMDEVLKHIDARFNELRSELKAQMLSSTDVQTMIDKALKDRPTLSDTQALISASQSAMQAQLQAANEAVVNRVENMVTSISAQLSGVNVMLAENKGMQSGLRQVVEVVIKQYEDNTRRLTNIEADTQRMEQRINIVKTDVDKLTDDIRAPGGLKEAVSGFKTYVERQQAVATVKQEFYTAAIGMLKNPVVLRVLGGILGGAGVGLGWAILNILGQ